MAKFLTIFAIVTVVLAVAKATDFYISDAEMQYPTEQKAK
jgi:hypothetical protein